MARTRSNNSRGGNSNALPSTRIPANTVEVPPHSTYASQGGTNPPPTDPISQGTNPLNLDLVLYGSGPQSQIVNAPLNTQGPGVSISDIVNLSYTGPYPLYGMPRNFGARASGHGQQPPPQYINSLGPRPGDLDYSGPYTDESDSSGDTHHRRRRRDNEPAGQTRSRNDDAEARSMMKQIRAYEERINKLKRDMEARQNRQTIPTYDNRARDRQPVIDLDAPPARADPRNLLPLGDPDNPTPHSPRIS